jgi:hypothetical protein
MSTSFKAEKDKPMIDLEQLKRLAEAALAEPGKFVPSAWNAFDSAANPDAILSLIQRVEEAEASKERTNYYHAIKPPKTTDP